MSNKNASLTYFVAQTNPEIFSASPRPGGLAKIDVPPKPNKLLENAAKVRRESQPSTKSSRSRSRMSRTSSVKVKPTVKDSTSTSPSRKSLLTVTTTYQEPKDLDIDSCPREFKVKQIIAATPWSVEFDEYLEPSEESKRILDPFQDSVDMLAMSISVIMLLSKGYAEISNTHFKWVISYLDCIRDEFGQTPPNVQGILNHINQLTGGQIKSYLDEDVNEPEELSDRQTSVRISSAPPTMVPEEDAPADG
ncbi:hypothetical protein D910_07329 [Dendroctonus ponderosae]|uniref:Uncharacterized protein n=1 Tax=Dendroctonus ponderosae TaxID=77166 RepID=U4UJ38_DENPD|nr:hypothetical protein D910_07329 [Dendroctonus ponderosae]KAH1025615.1 hypothetical protein HUJ05_010307 [Dendroctonus ponderosae]